MSAAPKGMAEIRDYVTKLANDSSLTEEQKWDTLWQKQITPWDRNTHSPALEELLVDKKFPLLPANRIGRGKGLVPGCGKGYDVALLAALEGDTGTKIMAKVVGLDVSSKAVEEARGRFEGEITGQGNIEFVKGDFFGESETWAKEGPYDVVYDYTVRFPLFSVFPSDFPFGFSFRFPSARFLIYCLGLLGAPCLNVELLVGCCGWLLTTSSFAPFNPPCDHPGPKECPK